jgi:hypothetical protein
MTEAQRKYMEKLNDPRWLMKRCDIIARDKGTCQSCGDTEGIMQVHHEYYQDGRDPWDYPDNALILLCKGCHSVEERNRKEAFRGLNRAIADAGFTREDVEKLTQAFSGIVVKPIYSYLVMSWIFRGVQEAYYDFFADTPGRTKEERAEYQFQRFTAEVDNG